MRLGESIRGRGRARLLDVGLMLMRKINLPLGIIILAAVNEWLNSSRRLVQVQTREVGRHAKHIGILGTSV